jgi:hypothetical protein
LLRHPRHFYDEHSPDFPSLCWAILATYRHFVWSEQPV